MKLTQSCAVSRHARASRVDLQVSLMKSPLRPPLHDRASISPSSSRQWLDQSP